MPMHKVDVHPDVYAELEHSRTWYEERAENLGIDFLKEVDNAINTIRQSPTIWPFRDKKQRIYHYFVHRFPYGIIYRIQSDVVQIIAVMHLRRHPNYWHDRAMHWNDSRQDN